MITNEQIKKTITECSKAKHSISLRDISYILLCKFFEDNATAYRVIYGMDADYNPKYVDTYEQTEAINYLRQYIESTLLSDNPVKKKSKKEVLEEDISFEENKAEILNLIKKTQQAFASGDIEAKDALKIEADLRVKLNDKFAVTEDVRDQIVVVQAKYSSICECGRECAPRPISKEEAMEMYDLVEK